MPVNPFTLGLGRGDFRAPAFTSNRSGAFSPYGNAPQGASLPLPGGAPTPLPRTDGAYDGDTLFGPTGHFTRMMNPELALRDIFPDGIPSFNIMDMAKNPQGYLYPSVNYFPNFFGNYGMNALRNQPNYNFLAARR